MGTSFMNEKRTNYNRIDVTSANIYSLRPRTIRKKVSAKLMKILMPIKVSHQPLPDLSIIQMKNILTENSSTNKTLLIIHINWLGIFPDSNKFNLLGQFKLLY